MFLCWHDWLIDWLVFNVQRAIFQHVFYIKIKNKLKFTSCIYCVIVLIRSLSNKCIKISYNIPNIWQKTIRGHVKENCQWSTGSYNLSFETAHQQRHIFVIRMRFLLDLWTSFRRQKLEWAKDTRAQCIIFSDSLVRWGESVMVWNIIQVYC